MPRGQRAESRRLIYTRCALFALVLSQASCALTTRVRVSDGASPDITELWVQTPAPSERNLYYGPGGRALKPGPNARFTFVSRDARGASPKLEVRDPHGLEWDVKLGPEARTEVVASRLVWAAGFHQPPTYYVPHWTLTGGPKPGAQGAARFRPRVPDLEKTGEWSWHENPFVGTRQWRALFVLMIMINNWDLKTPQNAIYQSRLPPHRRYVVRDLGASFGRTRWFFPGTKDDVEGFEQEGFIKQVENGRVRFHYRGAWREPHLDDQITPDDVRWICARLAKLTDQQWRDAFRAAEYPRDIAARFIARLRQKVAEGLQLEPVRTAEGETR